MSNILESIARENFRNSGYVQHRGKDRPSAWIFSSPPRSPFYSTDAVLNAQQRREKALQRAQAKPSLFRNCLNVFFHR